jgi:hypothetical protein
LPDKSKSQDRDLEIEAIAQTDCGVLFGEACGKFVDRGYPDS